MPDQRPPLRVGDHIHDHAEHRHPGGIGDHGHGSTGGERCSATISPGGTDGGGVTLREQRPNAGSLPRVIGDGDRHMVNALDHPVGTIGGEVMVRAQVHHGTDAQGDESSPVRISCPGQVPGTPQEARCGGATVGGGEPSDPAEVVDPVHGRKRGCDARGAWGS